jgi:hypothetical protein
MDALFSKALAPGNLWWIKVPWLQHFYDWLCLRSAQHLDTYHSTLPTLPYPDQTLDRRQCRRQVSGLLVPGFCSWSPRPKTGWGVWLHDGCMHQATTPRDGSCRCSVYRGANSFNRTITSSVVTKDVAHRPRPPFESGTRTWWIPIFTRMEKPLCPFQTPSGLTDGSGIAW